MISHQIETCPTAIVQAPADQIWRLLTTPSALAAWTGVEVIDGPDRAMQAGDRVVFGAGVGHLLRMTFVVLESLAPERLTLDILLPFRVINQETITVSPVTFGGCRVTFN